MLHRCNHADVRPPLQDNIVLDYGTLFGDLGAMLRLPPRILSNCGLLWLVFLLPAFALHASDAAATRFIAADHEALRCSDYIVREVLPDHSVRFERVLETHGRGYRWDNPGARIAFRTDARSVTAVLRYSDKHTSPSARAPMGIYYVDGTHRSEWTFTSSANETLRQPETVEVALPVPAARGFHDYAVVLPYGDSVEVVGLRLDLAAKFEVPPSRPNVRYVAFGDSITHGFTATHVGHTYAYRLAEKRGWQLHNLGFGGRTARPAEGSFVGKQGADVVSVFLGTNEWQGGVAPESYRESMRGLLAGIRALQPKVPIVVITALWVSPNWKPAKARFPLEAYRETLRALVAELADSNLRLVEGPSLIDHDERFFDKVLVHPNDAGFAQMAERLDRALGAFPVGIRN